MNAGTVQIPVPEKIIPFISSMPDGDTLEDKATLAAVVGLFAAKIVSLGKAAELAGKSLWEFIDILKSHQIPWGEYTEESAAMDDIAMKKLAQGVYK